jgi:hypothetical protein
MLAFTGLAPKTVLFLLVGVVAVAALVVAIIALARSSRRPPDVD